MKGVILGVEIENGGMIILGHDDKRYHLQKSEWKSAKEPKVGMEIDFVTSGDDLAKQAYCIPSTAENHGGAQFAMKARKTAGQLKRLQFGVACLCIFLGVVFYMLCAPGKRGNHDRQISGQQPSSDDATKNALYDKGFAEGREGGYLQGIDDARHNINQSQGMIRSIAKFAVKQTNNDLRGQGRPTMSEEEANGWVEGEVQGYADGQRKVFVDGQ
jgi:hypothetical protein